MTINRGFGLIEVLISMLIISITSLALVSLQKSYFNSYSDTAMRLEAYRIANTKLETISRMRSGNEFNTIAGSNEFVITNGVKYFVEVVKPQLITIDSYPDPADTKKKIDIQAKKINVNVSQCILNDTSCPAGERVKMASLSRLLADLNYKYGVN
ncbi:MAG: type IV pilus modification PilV family protein [Plesiomonas sp.]